MFDRLLPWLGEISELTMISHRTLPLESRNEDGVPGELTRESGRYPGSDLTTLRRTVVFLHS